MTYLENRRVLERTSTNIRNKIGVIVASGTIMDGSQPEGTIGGDTLAKMFTDLKDDENIAAVVLRIDSGGGSAFASEIIRESIISFRETDVPIIISMSSVAASGGYWISADADKIFAMPATITGSIGVWGMIPTIDESLANLGIYSDGVGTSDISGMYQIDRPMTERSKKLFQSGVESVYEKFIELVSNGRGLDQFSTQTIAQGKIWTGTQAINNGLVDQLGGLSQAIEEAANMAGLDDYQVKYFRKTLSPLEMIFLELNAEIRSLFSDHKADRFNNLALRNVQFSLKKNISMFNHLNDPNGEYLLCTLCGTID
jgi:protease-4